jgi:hypothetical protein
VGVLTAVSCDSKRKLACDDLAIAIDARDATDGCHRAKKPKKAVEPLEPRERAQRIIRFKLPQRIKSLFFDNKIELHRKMEVLHTLPNIYKIKNFLGKQELEYFDTICKSRKKFAHSFTENEHGVEVISEERTSTYKWFTKRENKFISLLEKKAADFVGMSVDNVEPLQMVAYTKGQSFREHHDGGENC